MIVGKEICRCCSNEFEMSSGLFGQCNGCIKSKQTEQIKCTYDTLPVEAVNCAIYASNSTSAYEEDAEYFRSKLYKALAIPVEYLQPPQVEIPQVSLPDWDYYYSRVLEYMWDNLNPLLTVPVNPLVDPPKETEPSNLPIENDWMW